MAVLLIAALSVCGNPVLGQVRDSIRKYNDQLSEVEQKILDHYWNNDSMEQVFQNLRNAYAQCNNYVGLTLSGTAHSSNYSALNAQLQPYGFPAIATMRPAWEIALSGKRGRAIHHFVYAAFGGHQRLKGNDQLQVEISNSYWLQYSRGLDLLTSPTWSLYPFAGAMLRIADVRITKSSPPIQNPNSFVGYSPVGNYTIYHQNGFCWQAGLGIDWVIRRRVLDDQKWIISLKGETRQNVNSAKIQAQSNLPQVQLMTGKWMLSLGVNRTFGRSILKTT